MKTTLSYEAEDVRDRFRGTLLGGAAGDALGFAVEFMSENGISDTYGEDGIQAYSLDPLSGKALFSDDTQMSLFTAEGIIYAKRNLNEAISLRHAIALAYRDWLITQEGRNPAYVTEAVCDLMKIPDLYSLRAPGNTCIGAMCQRRCQIQTGTLPESFLENRINTSKGCGAVMRAAPLGLVRTTDILALDWEGAEIGAITHGHSLGFMPSAMLVHIINRIVYPVDGMTLKDIVIDARNALKALFHGDESIDYMTGIIDFAIELSENDENDLDNIHMIGDGWVGEEAIAIAIYCALKHVNDFSSAITAAVNHKGDSDSTGAITGNILGAWVGYHDIENKWKEKLELREVILNSADGLYEAMQQNRI